MATNPAYAEAGFNVRQPVNTYPPSNPTIEYAPYTAVPMESELVDDVRITRRVEVNRVTNRWTDGICDWPKNIFPSVFCVCFVGDGCWLLAQSKLNFSFIVH